MNDKEIVKLYVDEHKSTYQIADIMNTYPNKIRRILIKNNVEIKDKSEAQKNALKSGVAKIPTLGRQRTKEEKLKISVGLTKKWQEITDKEYERRVEVAKKRWKDMSESDKRNMVSSAIKSIQLAGKEGSKLEKFLYIEITGAGFKIEQHKKNLIPNQNLEIDLYFPSLKTIIEIDGPSHFLPIWGDEKLQKQIKADSHKTGLILSKGFVIIRVKNLKDTLSLNEQEQLKNKLINMLQTIQDNFPKDHERYIEIEI
jgi:very-short-patch-repair endonuclease